MTPAEGFGREILTVDVAAMRARVNARYPIVTSRYEAAIA
jgi:hypothetical protein